MNKQQQTEEIAEILKNSATESAKYFQAEVKKAFRNGAKNLKRNDCEKSIHDIAAEALYNAGYRKVPYGAVDEITRHNSVEAELQELNIKYYNEAKDLRRELAKAEAEKERLKTQLQQANVGIVNCSGCKLVEINAVKEFAEKLKKNPRINNYGLEFVALVDIDAELKSLLKEYEK